MTAPTVRVSIPAPIYTRDPFASRFSRCSFSSSDYPDTPRTLTFDESGYTVPYTLRLDRHNHSISQLDSRSLFQPEHVRSTESEGVIGPNCSATCVKPATLSFFQFGFCQYFQSCKLSAHWPILLSSVSTALASGLVRSLIPSILYQHFRR